jgi:hypothetical protein
LSASQGLDDESAFLSLRGLQARFHRDSRQAVADTHLPLRLWFQAIWYVDNQKRGASALGVQRVLGLGSYRTAWSWLHKLRRPMVRHDRDGLSGTLGMDEVYIGGERPGKRGRGAASKALVLIAAQVDGSKIGRIRLARVANASVRSVVRQLCIRLDRQLLPKIFW